MKYWLLKSEPTVFGIDHLAALPHQTDRWDGVRNYQARNFLRDQMQCGDLAFFYHSNSKPPGIVGIVEIIRAGYPDPTAFIKAHRYYDANSQPDHPRWYCVDVRLVRRLNRMITLTELKTHAASLTGLIILQPGHRLSIMPVTESQWHFVLQLENNSN